MKSRKSLSIPAFAAVPDLRASSQGSPAGPHTPRRLDPKHPSPLKRQRPRPVRLEPAGYPKRNRSRRLRKQNAAANKQAYITSFD